MENEDIRTEITEEQPAAETETVESAEAAPAEDEEAISARENMKEWIKDIGIAVLIAVLLLQFIKPTIVREHSMENTLFSNDYLFVGKMHYKLFSDYERGDIIVFKSNLSSDTGSKKLLIKRIIALPGETISISGGVVYVDGVALEEDYTKDGFTQGEMYPVTVPEGCLFCMGDNRQNSADSRDSRIGFVEQSTVVGKAVIRLFPFNKIGTL